MRVYLLRHAIAAARDPERYPDDRLRPLTGAGRRKMERAAAGLASLDGRIDLVLTSPLLRAADTARLAVEALHPRPELRILKPLAPGGGSGGVLAGLQSLPADSTVLLVGHEPDLTQIAAALLLAQRTDLGLEFKKGGLCRIDFDGAAQAGNGRLVFHLTPRLLRRLRRKTAG